MNRDRENLFKDLDKYYNPEKTLQQNYKIIKETTDIKCSIASYYIYAFVRGFSSKTAKDSRKNKILEAFNPELSFEKNKENLEINHNIKVSVGGLFNIITEAKQNGYKFKSNDKPEDK